MLGMLEAALRATHHHRIAAAIPELLADAQQACLFTPIRASRLLSAIPGRADLATSFVISEKRHEFLTEWQSKDERDVAMLGAASWLTALWPSSPKGDESTQLLQEITRLHLEASKRGRPLIDAWRFGRAMTERQLAQGDVQAARASASALFATLATDSDPLGEQPLAILERIAAERGSAVAEWFANLISDLSMILADASQCDPPDWEALDRAAVLGLTAEEWIFSFGKRSQRRFGADPIRRAHLLNRRGVAARARGALAISLPRAMEFFKEAKKFHDQASLAILDGDWRADAARASTKANLASLMIEQAYKEGNLEDRQRTLQKALEMFEEVQKKLDRPQLVEARIATLNDAAWTAGQLAGLNPQAPFGSRSEKIWHDALELARAIPNARVAKKWEYRILKNRASARSARKADGAEDDALQAEGIRTLLADGVQFATADAPYLSWHERGTVPTPPSVGLSEGFFDRHRELLVLLIDMERDLRKFIDQVHCKHNKDKDLWLKRLGERDQNVRNLVKRCIGRGNIVNWNGNAPDVLANAYICDYWVLMKGKPWEWFEQYLDKNRTEHWKWMLGDGVILRKVRNSAAHGKYSDVQEWEVVAVEAAALELIARMRTVR